MTNTYCVTLSNLPTNQPWRNREILKRYYLYYQDKGHTPKECRELAHQTLDFLNKQGV